MARFAVIGLGRFGMRLARLLCQAGAEVIAIDQDRDLVEQISDDVTLAVRLDATDAEALRTQGVDKVTAAVVGIGTDFEAAALTVLTLKSIGVKRVLARAGSNRRGQILRQIGADEVVFPEAESAKRWAQQLMLPTLRDFVELGEGHSLVQLRTPKSFAHKTPEQLRLRPKYGVNLVAIRRTVKVRTDTQPSPHESHIFVIPQADTALLPDDVLILVGTNEDLAKLPSE